MTPDGLEPMETSSREIAELLNRYRIAVADATVDEQSADGRYVDAYTAGFLLAKIVVRASGHRVKGGENHRDTLLAVPWLMGSNAQASIDSLDAARKRRNATMYDAAGLVDNEDVSALLVRVALFEGSVRDWLAASHPEVITNAEYLEERGRGDRVEFEGAVGKVRAVEADEADA